MNPRGSLVSLILLLVPPAASAARDEQPDVYVFVIDDVADSDIDAIATPNIDTLAGRGVRFRRAYSMPKCSQTRHALLFSEYFAGDHDENCKSGGNKNAPPNQLSLARSLGTAGYETALFGKWHLGSNATGPWEISPHLFGFEHWRAGLFINVKNCGGTSYTDWLRVDDGVSAKTTQYTLEAIYEAFSTWVSTRSSRPRFAIIAFQTAHLPWVVPPAHLLLPGYVQPEDPTKRELFEAGVMAVDHVLGIMLPLLDPDAWIVLIGDNGTPQLARRPNQEADRVKGSVFEDGIRVPFIVVGPRAAVGTETGALVHVVDILPTLAAVLDLPQEGELDGVSFLPTLVDPEVETRPWIYSAVDPNKLTPLREEAIVEERWKLRVVDWDREEFYELSADPTESSPLAAERVPAAVVERLRAELRAARR